MAGKPDLIPLALLLQELRNSGDLLGREVEALDGVKHRTVFGAVLDGMIPAERVNNRWFIRRADLGKIAKMLVGKEPVRRGRTRKALPEAAAA